VDIRTGARRTTPTTLIAVVAAAVLALVVAGCSVSDGSEDSSASARAGVTPRSEPSAPPTDLEYVAIGDSFTSAPLVPVTDVANGCFRSSENYPALVARELGAELDDRSCGGARTEHFLQAQFAGVQPQITGLKPSTDLVTVSIGGNDQQVFATLVERCPQLRGAEPDGAPCREEMGAGGSDRLLTALVETRKHVIDLLTQVRKNAPEAKVLVVGYPQIVSADNACDELPLARGDYAYAEEVNRALTEALRSAALATGTTYVDVWAASRGHDICSEDPWVNGAVSDQKRAAAYHPFAEEQAAVAELVLAEVETG
jgi:lysophospholipase L1-like esterase